MKFWKRAKAIIGDSLETISEKTVELSHSAKLNWEKQSLQKSINKEFNELGGIVYHLFAEKQEDKFTEETKEVFEKLTSLYDQLKEKDKLLEEISEDEEVDREQLREFRKDLEMGGGAIEQYLIEEKSSLVNKKLKDIQLPKNVLLGAVVRENKVIIPDGQTTLKIGDRVTFIGEKDEIEEAMKMLTPGSVS
ncbi:hypothetical protein H8E88_23145 [candidate division KSB1 bacterium]|nr:hypothetical protein [candidate division KSB1 bacterium]